MTLITSFPATIVYTDTNETVKINSINEIKSTRPFIVKPSSFGRVVKPDEEPIELD